MEIPQYLINWGLGIAAGVLGWWGRQMWDSQKELHGAIQALEIKLAENYVPTAQMQLLKDEIFVVLRRIEDKLETKVSHNDRSRQ